MAQVKGSVPAQMRAALAAGRNAAQSGAAVTSNPYDAASRDSRQRVLARMWLTGYGAGNPMPVDYSS